MKTSTILRIFRSRTHVAMVTGALMFALACDKIPEAAGAEAASDIDRKEARHTDRDVENLKRLSEQEKTAWQQLWTSVKVLMAKTNDS